MNTTAKPVCAAAASASAVTVNISSESRIGGTGGNRRADQGVG